MNKASQILVFDFIRLVYPLVFCPLRSKLIRVVKRPDYSTVSTVRRKSLKTHNSNSNHQQWACLKDIQQPLLPCNYTFPHQHVDEALSSGLSYTLLDFSCNVAKKKVRLVQQASHTVRVTTDKTHLYPN